jgi:cytochrome c biogenesis factor
MAFELKNVVPWGRNLEEYTRIFKLTDLDFNSHIISFGDGPASFNSKKTKMRKSHIIKIVQCSIENFVELFLVLIGVISVVYLFHWKQGIDSSAALFLGLIFGIIFGVIFILQIILLFARWTKKERKKYIAEKYKLLIITLLAIFILSAILDPAIGLLEISNFLIGLACIAIVFIIYLCVISLLSFCKKIITSKTNAKWIKGLLILFGCAIAVSSTVFMNRVIVEHTERMYWQTTCTMDTHYEYHSYLEKYPNGKYVEDALWRAANALNTLEEYDTYLEKYPNGKYKQECLQKKIKLNSKKFD